MPGSTPYGLSQENLQQLKSRLVNIEQYQRFAKF